MDGYGTAQADGPTLLELSSDGEVVRGPKRPRFPASLLQLEKRYLAALASSAETATTGGEQLRAAIASLLLSDMERLESLPGGYETREEQQFLRARIRVLETRLRHLTAALASPEPPLGDGAPVAGPPGSAPAPEAAPPDPDRERERDVIVRPRHRSDIQGLRAVAVLVVVLSHAKVGLFKGGFVGVDVFFVLSGFLITSLLLEEARRRRWVSLSEFYLRRARRILPAAALTLLVTDVAAYYLLNFVRAKQYLQDSIPSLLFGANIHFASQGTNYFAQGQPPSPLQHFWSLSVEEQFYFVWPLLFILLLGLAVRRFAHRPREIRARAVQRAAAIVGVLALASLGWSIYQTHAQPAGAYFSTFSRAWELALGAGLALMAARFARVPLRWRVVMGWAGLAAIVAAAVTYSGAIPFPGYAALLPTIGAALVIAAGISVDRLEPSARTPLVGRVLSLAPLRYVGDRSYAFYLWHWPVLILAAQHAGHNLSVTTNLLLMVGAFALSAVTYAVYESPLRRARWARKPVAILPWVTATAVVLVVATTYISKIDDREQRQADLAAAPVGALAAPQGSHAATPVTTTHVSTAGIPGGGALPAVQNAVDTAGPLPAVLQPPVGQLLSDYPHDVPSACMAHDGQTTSDLCRAGAAGAPRTVVLMGDSHAEMWVPAVIAMAQRDRWTVVLMLKSGCSPLLWTAGGAPADCRAWYRWALSEDRSLRPSVTLLAGYYSYAGPLRDRSVSAAFDGATRALEAGSRRVVIMGDIPERFQQPVDCLLAPHASEASCTGQVTANDAALDADVSAVAARDHAGFIDPTGWFCYAGKCPLVVGHVITYRDSAHASTTYVMALRDVFRAAFRAELGQT